MTVKYALIAGLALAGSILGAPPTFAVVSQNALHVATDNAEVVNLAGTPSVVLIANPQIADVVVEQGHLIFVIGKRPGQTRLFVYGAGGKSILERDVVVVPPRERAVTIIRATTPTDYSCDPRCVALGPGGPAGSTAGVPPAASAPPVPLPASAPPAPATSAAVAAR